MRWRAADHNGIGAGSRRAVGGRAGVWASRRCGGLRAYFGGDVFLFVFGAAAALLTIGGWIGSPNTLRLVGCGANELALCGVPTGR